MRTLEKFQYKSLFKVGDRVVFTHEIDPDGEVIYGQKGEVRSISSYADSLGVRWDERNEAFHDVDGNCEYGHGWWVPAEMCEKETAEAEIPEIDADSFNTLLGGGF